MTRLIEPDHVTATRDIRPRGSRRGPMTATLARQTFQTSRLLEYFSEKELTLQTGAARDRAAQVVVPATLERRVRETLEAHPTMAWDAAVADLAREDRRRADRT